MLMKMVTISISAYTRLPFSVLTPSTTSKASTRSRKKDSVADVDKGTGAIVGEEPEALEDAIPSEPLDNEEALAKEAAQAESEDIGMNPPEDMETEAAPAQELKQNRNPRQEPGKEELNNSGLFK